MTELLLAGALQRRAIGKMLAGALQRRAIGKLLLVGAQWRRTIGKRLGIRSGAGGRGGAGVGDEVLRCNLYLEAADARADKDAWLVKGAQVDKGGERLLHPDGRAAAADIAGKGQKLLLVNQRATFVAGELSCRLKVNLVVARYYADKEPRFVSPKHKCFEDCRNIFAEFRGNVLCGEVLL